MLQEIEISFDVSFPNYVFSIEKIWRHQNKLYVLSQLDVGNNEDYGFNKIMRDKVSVEVGRGQLEIKHFVIIKPWSHEFKKLFRPSGYKAKVIMAERNVSDQVRSEGVCLYARHQPLPIAEPPAKIKQNISVGLSVPFSQCDFHLLHVWEYEGRLIVTSRLNYLVRRGRIATDQLKTFCENVSVNVLNEMPVEHYLITNRNPSIIRLQALAGYKPQFLKHETDLPPAIIDGANCLFENDVSDSELHLKMFITEMLYTLSRRLYLINSNPDPNAEPFYIYREPSKSFITFVVICNMLRIALRKEQHDEEDKNYILFAGDAQHILEEGLKKNELNFDEYDGLIERFGFNQIDQGRLAALFKKYDTVYKKVEPYNGLTLFKTAAIVSLGAATAALTSYALASHK